MTDMANPSYEKEGKTYLQCKECGEFKEINSENWYSHKEGFLGVLGRCRKCILKGRSSEREHIMSRKRDMNRYHNSQKRKDDIYRRSKDRIKKHEENGIQWRALHAKTDRLISYLRIRPTECPICGKQGRIVAHHPLLENRWEVAFCCSICHSKIHSGEISNYKIIDLKKENPKYSLLTPGEIAQMDINEKCRSLRKKTLPPTNSDCSEEGIERWRNL